MGSGKSRGKRIAPANETDAVNNDSVKGDGNSKSSAEPFRVRASTSLANKNTQLDCHPEGQHSEWSTDLDGELEEILAEADEKEGHVNKDSLVKKRFFSSKTFGLCNYIRVRDDQRVASTHQLPNAGLVTGSSNHAEISVKEKRQLSNKPLRKTSSTSTHHQQVGNYCVESCPFLGYLTFKGTLYLMCMHS